jgi:glycosyltransferase involved in cell wall biosynthesis
MSVETLRKEFESLGHEVFIFAPNYSDYQDTNKKACPIENFSEKNIRRVFRYPSLDINIKFRLPLGIPYSCKMDKILESLELDIIHSHHPNLLGTAALKWAKKKNIPLVFTWHTLYDQYTNFVPFLPARFSANWIIKKAVKYANQADVVIVPTESVMPIIQNWGVEGKIIPVATGVIEAEFSDANRNEIRGKYDIKENEILLLLVSRLTAEKNIKFLFDAVIEVLKENENIHPVKSPTSRGAEQFNRAKFMLVGDGYLVPELKEKAKKENLENKIIFTGIIERANLKNYYAAGDIFVYASKSETQGMIITEAMYMGLPIVAVKATGIESLVENNVNGILTSENSPSEIASSTLSAKADISRGKDEFISAVKKLIETKDLQEKMSLESARIAREKYTSKICAAKMLEVYKEVIKYKNKKS